MPSVTVVTNALTITTLWANSADDKLMGKKNHFSWTGFDISCKLSPLETICLKCQNLFSGKKKKSPICCLLKFLPRVLSVKG